MNNLIAHAVQWYTTPHHGESKPVCATRDVFQARLDTMYRALLQRGHAADHLALLISIIGEIGNNSFDHNVGQWDDIPGCWFQYSCDASPYWIVLADHGQGMLASLQRVDPQLRTHQNAVDTAFQKHISGRAPEQRGNGLKFVRSVINGHPRKGLWCASGDGTTMFGGLAPQIAQQMAPLYTALPSHRGTCSVIAWEI